MDAEFTFVDDGGNEIRATKIAASLPVSAEVLYGSSITPTSFMFRPPPTPEEVAAREQEHRERAGRLRAFNNRLSTITDPAARIVLDIHVPDDLDDSWVECEGCDFGGYEGEPPRWPCRTVEALAEHYGITLPDA